MLKNIYQQYMGLKPLSENPGQTESNSYLNKDGSVKTAINPDSDLSKMGLTNVFTGTKQSLNHTKNQLLGNDMTKNGILNEGQVFSILNEGLTEHIQKNANRYAGGALIGAGLAAGHAITGGDFNLGGNDSQNQNSSQNQNNQPQKTWKEQVEDKSKDIGTVETKVDASKNGGLWGAFTSGLNHAGDVKRASIQVENVERAKNELDDAINNRPDLLSTGEKITLGGAGAGALSLATLKALNKRKK